MLDKSKLIFSGIMLMLCCAFCYKFYQGKTKDLVFTDAQMDMVLSLEDEISDNAVWCGTFNLIWNDLKSEIVKQDIVFDKEMKIVENLNKGTFTTKMLDDDSYYKKYGKPSLELKEEIEKSIKDKFNETSSILDSFNWDGEDDDYFLYAMLKKEFHYPVAFTKLESGNFGNTKDIEYFGIDSSTKDEVRNQVVVLYFQDDKNFAFKLKTKENDEVLITMGSNKMSFKEIYDEVNKKAEEYQGSKRLKDNEKLKIPYIDFKIKKEFEEIQNKNFMMSNGKSYVIDKALQTIEFLLDEKGGKVKSEAGMGIKGTSLPNDDLRHFLVDDTFVLFLKENDKDLPYLAMKVSDITKFVDK